jgi:hypothetical protein
MKIAGRITTLRAVLIAAAFLSGCTTVDLSKFHDADLKEAEIMPSKAQLNQQRIKVVVFEADEGHNQYAMNAHLGETFAKALEKEITEAGTEIVDRNLAGKLKDELKLAEVRGSGNYNGPEVANYVVRGKLSSAEPTTTFHEAMNVKGPDGKYYYTPAYYEHVGKVGGIVNIYELPSLRLINTFTVEGTASAQDQANWRNWYANREFDSGGKLLRDATFAAIKLENHQLKNIFAPKGYVVERRTDGDKSIFKVLMGSGQGVKTGDKVVIYTLRNKHNRLTEKDEIDELPVAIAKVSDQVTDTFSWVAPDDKDASAKVRLGDYVKVQFDQSLASKMNGLFK